MKRKDLENILKQNKSVDKKKLEKTMENIDTLRKIGVKQTKYQLAPPYANSVCNCKVKKGDKAIV